MKRTKLLYESTLKDFKSGVFDTKLGVYGVFDTKTVKWTYYLISFFMRGSTVTLTDDLCIPGELTIWNVDTHAGKKVNTVNDGIVFIEDFKIKWETGSNDSKSVIRDQKLSDILDESTTTS